MRKPLVILAIATAIVAAPLQYAMAQKLAPGRGMSDGVRGGGGGYHGGGGRGWGGLATGLAIGTVTGIIMSQPPAGAVEQAPPPQRAQRPSQNQPQRNARGSGAPPPGETRLVPDEVVIELPDTI